MKLVLYLLVAAVVLLVAALLVTYMLWGGSPWPTAPPQVVEGGRWLRVVEFDRMRMTVKDEDGSRIGCEDFELRVSEDGGVKSVLIRGMFVKDFTRQPDGSLVQSSTEELLYSDDTYAVSLVGALPG